MRAEAGGAVREQADYDSDSDDPRARIDAARAVALFALLPILLVACVVLGIAELAGAGEWVIRRRLR